MPLGPAHAHTSFNSNSLDLFVNKENFLYNLIVYCQRCFTFNCTDVITLRGRASMKVCFNECDNLQQWRKTNCGNNLLCTMCFTEYACSLKGCNNIYHIIIICTHAIDTTLQIEIF